MNWSAFALVHLGLRHCSGSQFRQPGERRHRSRLPVSQDLATGQPNCCTTFDPRPSRQTMTSGLVTSYFYKKGGSSIVPVRCCLGTKEKQQVEVRCSESRFPSSIRVPPMTGDSSAFVDKGSIMKRTTLRSLILSMQQN